MPPDRCRQTDAESLPLQDPRTGRVVRCTIRHSVMLLKASLDVTLAFAFADGTDLGWSPFGRARWHGSAGQQFRATAPS
ncbi:hypothetical protein [Paragemmobacter aquarius]|uniref:hypothetical protein n=1 Tax=Paragemmobacter aquarius TaxID=2169400 RepID=UPI001C2000F6|nr:hypothetical protein [Gemmobacter aquarius]